MKRSILKKTAAFMMAAMMMFSVVGCGRKENERKEETKNMVYEGKELEVEGMEGAISSISVNGERVYLSTNQENEETEGGGNGIVKLYSMNLDGSDMKELPVSGFAENECINFLSVNDEGLVFMLSSLYDERTKSQTFYLRKEDKDGKEIWKEDITETLNLIPEQDYISRVLCADKGRVLVFTSGQVFVFDENAKLLDKMKADFSIMAAAKTKEGKIICGAGGEDGAFVQEIDIDGKKWGKKHEVDVTYFMGTDSLMDGAEYDFYYRQDEGIFGYDLKEDKAVEVMDFAASNLTSGDTWGMLPIGNEKFLSASSDGVEKKKLMAYSKVDPSTVAEKKTITFQIRYMNSDIEQAVIDFNKKNKEYEIEVISYDGVEDPTAKMNAEIAAGNIPDIIDLSTVNGDMYASKGMVEDLIPYIEKDKELSTDDFIPNVFEAMKTEDKLYSVSPNFFIRGLVGRTKDVGKEVGWTVDDMKAVIEKNKKTARPFYDNYKSTYLWMVSDSFDDFVNWQTGKCNFDSEEFKSILELCNTGENGESEPMTVACGNIEEFQNGEIMFSEGVITLRDIVIYKEMFWEDFTFIGYPNKDKSGSYFYFNQQLGISSKSEHKEAAWEFVRTFLTKEYQGQMNNNIDTPTRKDCYNMMVKAMTTTEEYTDEFGKVISPLEGNCGLNDIETTIQPFSKDEVAKYEELLNNTHKRMNSDGTILAIIEEEAKQYFAGDRDVDATAEIIQNRATTYVNENR